VENSEKRNLIILFCDLENFTSNDLLNFYDSDNISVNYHPQFIIVTKSNKYFDLPYLKRIDPNFIRIVEGGNIIELMIYMNEITSYYNELGDEIGFPKKIINKELIDRDSSLLMVKDYLLLIY
jgi:hypothetical protein